MKKVISIMIILMIITQGIILYMFFSNKLIEYQKGLVDIIWLGSALLGTLFGFLYFRLNRGINVPVKTAVIIAITGIIAFPFLIYGYWIGIIGLFIMVLTVHFYKYKDNQFTIFPVLSSIIGIYSSGLYLLMRGITSM